MTAATVIVAVVVVVVVVVVGEGKISSSNIGIIVDTTALH
jgi:hypothetical protein